RRSTPYFFRQRLSHLPRRTLSCFAFLASSSVSPKATNQAIYTTRTIYTMSPSASIMSQGWSVTPSSSSPWNAGILLDVPTILNQYPPGLSHGAWRTTPASTTHASSSSLDQDIATGSKRPRSTPVQSSRRVPPPPALSRLRTIPVAFPAEEDPLIESRFAEHDENKYISSAVIYRSPNSRPRMRA